MGDHVADHPDIRVEGELIGAEPFDQLDAERAQLVAHRRVDVGVAAGDLVAGLARQRGDAAHEGAADAEDVDVHGPDYHGAARLSFREAFAQLHLPELAVDVRGTASMNS